MKKLIVLLLPLLMVASCTKDLTELNQDPKSPQGVPSYTLFTQAQRLLSNNVTSSNVNRNIFRLIVQHWTQTTYTDESNYDLGTRGVPGFVWNEMYRDVLRDFQEARKLIPMDVPNAVTRKNQLAIVDIMEVYAWYYLLTTFGNIPYSEALNIENPFPKYDEQQAVFADLLKRLDGDISALDVSGASFGPADIIYGGDVPSWKKFAASFKLKIGMTLADADPAASKSAVESAVAAGIFTSNLDNAKFKYLSGPPNHNPIWEDLVQSNRQDFVAAKTIVDKMNAFADPRRPFYFTPDALGGFSGGIPGTGNNFATFSKPAGPLLVPTSQGRITNPDFPSTLLDYAEVEFFLAEAKERGYAVTGTAEGHYREAVTASITDWGGTTSQAGVYLAQASVAYTTAMGDYKQKIGEQKYLALYNRGWDAWIEQRRLDYPTLIAPATALTAYPVRFTYSVEEQNINTKNYNQAAGAIGGDKVTTKLYWDKF